VKEGFWVIRHVAEFHYCSAEAGQAEHVMVRTLADAERSMRYLGCCSFRIRSSEHVANFEKLSLLAGAADSQLSATMIRLIFGLLSLSHASSTHQILAAIMYII
jgi:hypothetical protein